MKFEKSVSVLSEKQGIMGINIGKHLLDNGIKPSYQRMKIYEYLITKKNHPTIDMIYKELRHDIPTFSKTTVYNTMELFIKKGIAIMLTIDENETRYDADTSVHTHFKCEKCSYIYDLHTNLNVITPQMPSGHKVTEQHLYLKGICKTCLSSYSN